MKRQKNDFADYYQGRMKRGKIIEKGNFYILTLI